MREIVLMVVVAVICVAGVVRPLIGLYGYLWFALMRPDVLAWSAGNYPYSLALAIATIVGSVRYFASVRRIFTNPLCLLLIGFQATILLSILTSPHPEWCWGAFDQFERACIMALLIPAFIYTPEPLKWLVLLMGASLGFVGAKFGLFGLLAGGARFSEGYGGMLSDNNDFALAMAMSIGPMYYLRHLVRSAWLRLAIVVMIFSSCAAIVMTYSRGGAITLAVVLLFLILRSRHKIAGAVMVFILAAPAVYLMGDSYQERLSTIAEPTKEASANSRFELAKAAWQMWQDYPLTGVGFGGGNFARMSYLYTTVQNGSVAHNTYMQVLVDTGIFGALFYLALLWGTIFWLGISIRRTRKESPDIVCVPVAIQTSLIAFAVGCTFLSRVTLDITYMYIMAAASWWYVARRERHGEVESPAPQDDSAHGLSAHAITAS